MENTKRIEDYAIFTLPRVIEGFFDFFIKIGCPRIPYFIEILFAISISLFLYLRNFDEDKIPSGYLRALNFVFGKK